MARYVPADRDTSFPPPRSVQDWLPKHLTRFVVGSLERMDLSAIDQSGAGRGNHCSRPSFRVPVTNAAV